MAPEFYNFFKDTEGLDMELIELQNLYKFWVTYSDYNHSDSKVGHLGRGWFMIYDYPLAEEWFGEQEGVKKHRMTDTSYAIFECSNSKAIEAKLIWC